jgi:hypothetical protein
MALHVVYAKVAEDDRQVEYGFGESLAELDRRLVIDTLTEQWFVRDGVVNMMVEPVVAMAWRHRRQHGSWPADGIYQA